MQGVQFWQGTGGHWAIPGDVFGCQHLQGRSRVTTLWMEAKGGVNYPTVCRTASPVPAQRFSPSKERREREREQDCTRALRDHRLRCLQVLACDMNDHKGPVVSITEAKKPGSRINVLFTILQSKWAGFQGFLCFEHSSSFTAFQKMHALYI